MQKTERHYRIDQFAKAIGYSVATIRKKIARREIGYRKVGRIIAIPESELHRLMSDYRPAIGLGAAK